MSAHISLVLALLVFAAPASAQRLSGDVVSEHYTLWFAPDLENATFRGRETIRVQLRAPANSITLHVSEIEFGEVPIEAAGSTQAARVTLETATETVALMVPRRIPAGAATIRMTYTGILNDVVQRCQGENHTLRGYFHMRSTECRSAKLSAPKIAKIIT